MRHIIELVACLMLLLTTQCFDKQKETGIIMTVRGPISAGEIGLTLTHEHILVDFIGADSINESRWDKAIVGEKVAPYLKQVKDMGCKTFIDATPEYIGRDPLLLQSISKSAGINIITNTGYYGAGNSNKFLPKHACTETTEQLAERWIAEWTNGIGTTGIKPGFIKIGVTKDSLSELHAKLVHAAARTHLKTGLVIASHTGPALPAFQQIEILKKEGVDPSAFIWVHAQGEKDSSNHLKAAEAGAWVSLDGINENNIEDYLSMITNMKQNSLLGKVLLSHDAGWYDPAKENGGEFRGFTTLFEKLLPALRNAGFTDDEINQLLVKNPAEAFTVRIRKL
jgi:phosphotriesterase-related protein